MSLRDFKEATAIEAQAVSFTDLVMAAISKAPTTGDAIALVEAFPGIAAEHVSRLTVSGGELPEDR